jgi:hypothetical protein
MHPNHGAGQQEKVVLRGLFPGQVLHKLKEADVETET